MGKDREGKYHPPKGRPSDTSREGTGMRTTITPEKQEQDRDMTKKFMKDEETLAENIHVQHPNRNTQKGEPAKKLEEEGKRRTWNEQTYSGTDTGTRPEILSDIPDKELLKEMASFHSSCSITMILPTHRSGMEVNEQQDRIGYKNALQDIIKMTEEWDLDEAERDRLLAPAFELLRNDQFWHHRTNGLALFIAPDFFRYMNLTEKPEKELMINNRFYLLPLVTMLERKNEFHFLYLSRKKTRLFHINAFGIRSVQTDTLPGDINDVIRFADESEEEKPDITGSGNNASEAPENIGSGRPEKEIVQRYLEKIRYVLKEEVYRDQNIPLMIGGQEELVNSMKNAAHELPVFDTMATEIAADDPNALYEHIMDHLKNKTSRHQDESLEEYYNQVKTARTASIPADVIPAANYSKVETLFILKGHHIWGKFDEQNNRLDIHDRKERDDDCLIDQAARETILHGGRVLLLDEDKMPAGSEIAAILRY